MSVKRNRHNIKGLLNNLFGLIVALISIFPLIWMVIASFKPENEVLGFPFRLLPTRWVPDNYIQLFANRDIPFLSSIKATLIVSIIATVLSLIIATMAAYAFARLDFKFKKSMWAIVITTMYIPGIATMIPAFILMARMNLLNTYAVLILPSLAYAYNILFFRQFFLSMPVSIEEAALIDGASRFQIFHKIFLPMSTSPMVIVGVSIFVGYWNSFVWPSITVSDPSLYQVTQIIQAYNATYAQKYGVVMAGSTLVAVIPIALFLIFQRYIVKGITLTGLK